MKIREELTTLFNKLKKERDSIKLKIHLASMEVREEFDVAEKKWHHVKSKMGKIADEATEVSEEYILMAKEKSEELKDAYHRITKRLNK